MISRTSSYIGNYTIWIFVQDKNYEMVLSEEGKVTGIYWSKNAWVMSVKIQKKPFRQTFTPRHYDCTTNVEQVKAAHRAAVARRAEFVTGLFYLYSSQFSFI